MSEQAMGDEMTARTLVEQYVRCYTVPDADQIRHRRATRHPDWARKQAAKKTAREATTGGAGTSTSGRGRRRDPPVSPEGQAIKAIGAPYEGWCLVFDTETTIDTTQALRYGTYAIYGLDRDTRVRLYRRKELTRAALDTQHEAGLFYDPDTVSAQEVATIQRYARRHGLVCLTRDQFVERFYYWVFRCRALCIGHNLPFDLSRLARQWADAAGEYRGGFTLKLCRCSHGMRCFDHPPIRIKQLARHKAWITFQQEKPLAAEGKGRSRRPQNGSRFYATEPVRGKFLDTATFGRALLGPGDLSLRGLGARFRACQLKWQERPDLSGPVSRVQLTYCRRDVAATWALFQAERALYRLHGLGTPMWEIYSEASLGKSYLKEFGVPPFLRAHPEVAPTVHGYGMTGYYGGRSEVRIRLQPTEGVYCDCKSQYPTVNALMGLQALLLAKTVTVRDATAEVRTLLEAFTLDQLHDSTFWRQLRVLVQIRPHDDLLPVRAEYGPEGRNIAEVYATGPAVWYPLADVLASLVRTGRVPEVLQAVELVPSVEQIATRRWTLFGDERYVIDLARQDFFTEVINLRTAIAADRDRAKANGRMSEAAYLDGLQLALKLLANSTSYGVLLEVIAEEPVSEPLPVTVYSWRTHRTSTPVVERTGRYFAGALGALIPAGGRLLLAIAERLATDRGLGYAMCDTDSMAFARPDGLPRAVFHERVQAIRDWFTPLSPYRGQPDLPPIFEEEPENRWEGQPEPLYYLGVSAKRGVHYNRLPDGTYRIRKFSSHGVGMWQHREGYVSPPHIPDPCEPVHELGGERWHYDLWYEAIRAMDSRRLPDGRSVPRDEQGVPQYVVPANPWLDTPAFHQVTISTAHLLRTYRDVPGIRPFNFITVLPALTREQIFWRLRRLEQRATAGEITWAVMNDAKAVYEGLAGVTFYAPYAASVAGLRDVRRSDTHALVAGIEPLTLAETLRTYYRHPEWKSDDPHGVGCLPRRHVTVLRLKATGRETNGVALASAEETDGVVGGEEAGMDAAQVFDIGNLAETLQQYSVAEWVRATGVPRRTLYDLRSGKVTEPHPKTLAAITCMVTGLQSE